jgi:phosphoribosylglycinamide formyltransferase 1
LPNPRGEIDMSFEPVHTPGNKSPMKVVGFISGSGSNLVKILEYQAEVEKQTGEKPYEVVLVFTDTPDSNASAIAERFGLPLQTHDIMDFYRKQGKSDKKDLSLRSRYDEISVQMLAEHQFDLVALAGYMSIVTAPLLAAYDGRIVNVHPADLNRTENGRRLYTGDHAVALAIKAGETAVYSSTHIVREQVDYGELLMVSAPVPVELPEGTTVELLRDKANRGRLNEIADQHQERLKEKGDWVIFPRTLELIAQGKFGFDENGRLLFEGKPIPNGYRE